MRRLLPALLCALAVPAVAQPTAADSALVDRLIDGLRLEMGTDAMAAVTDSAASAARSGDPAVDDALEAMMAAMRVDPVALGDSVRASVFDDFRPALVAEAVAFLEGLVFDRVFEAMPFAPGTVGPDLIAELAEDPGDRPLADSALAAGYARAVLEATESAEVQRITVERMLELLPASVRSEVEAQGGPEAIVEATLSAETREAQLATALPATRVMLAAVDEADVRAATAFYESEAGRYVMRQSALGTLRLMVPRMVAAMRPAFEEMERAVKALDRFDPKRGRPGAVLFDEDFGAGEPGFEGPGGLPPGLVEPELVGGLAGLQARVVYPDGARADGVEGRVLVQFDVDERGRVVAPEVVRSPDDRLSEAALAAVRGATFKPGRQDGKPVRVRFSVPVEFRLGGPPATDG